MTIRLPAVEDVLGAPVNQLTAADLQRAVDDHVRELPDLDFKQTLYGNAEELAKDLAAMANATGGLIVLGIGEDNGTAQRVTPVVLSDGEERRMHQALRSRTVPFIPDVEIRPVALDATDAGEQQGFYLIAVGRSLLAPHGVMSQGDDKRRMYWPVRSGTTTRYLSEPELAEFYRRRFRGEEARDTELNEVWDEGMAQIYNDHVWLAVAAVPSLPGQLPVGVAGLHRVQDVAWRWADGTWPQSIIGGHLKDRLGRFVPGVRRTRWDADKFEKVHPVTGIAEFHNSGAAFVATAVCEAGSDAPLDQQWIEAELLVLLYLLGCHVRECRAAGELTVRAALHTQESRKRTIGRRLSGQAVKISGALSADSAFTSDSFTVGIDELATYEGAARVAYQFAVDFAGWFGVPDAGLLTERGTLRQDSGGLPGFFDWTEDVGLIRDRTV